MREGLDNDDLYIMVEDEFLATAQAFTRHLHYAEYVRRKKQAKLAGASSISRPTDYRSKMSNETKKRLEADEASAKHKAVLAGMSTRPRVDSEVEDVDDSEEDKDDDPWMGTTLQPLMAATRQPRSLVGLHKIKSSTKAALARDPNGRQISIGLRMGLTSQRSNRQGGSQQSNLKDQHSRHAVSKALPAIPSQQGTQTTSKKSLKLDSRLPPLPSCRETGPRVKFAQHATELAAQPTYHANASTPQVDLMKPRSASSNEPTNKSSTYTTQFSKFLDELDEPVTTTNKVENGFREAAFGARPAQDRSRPKRREQDEKLKKQRLSEVPTFL